MSEQRKRPDDGAEVKRQLEYPNGAARDVEMAKSNDRWGRSRYTRRNYGPLPDEPTPDVVDFMEGLGQ